MFFLAQADNSGAFFFTGIIGSILGFSVVFVAVVWIVFPLIVNSKFNALIREVRNLRTELKMRRDADRAERDEENAQRRTSNAQSRMEEKRPEPTVYKID